MNKLYILGLLLLLACGGKKQEADSETDVSTTEQKVGSDAELIDGQRVFFVNLEDGAEVTSPFTIQMGVEGMEIEPAGEPSYHKGHHHLLINDTSLSKGTVIPADSTHIHYGKGQTEAELSLPPGDYQLTLQFADGFHRSYGAQMSASIQVVVIE